MRLLKIALLVALISNLDAKPLSLEGAPSWVFHPSMPQRCSLGIGSHTSDNPQAQSMIISVLEQGMQRQSLVKGMDTLFKSSKIYQEKAVAKLSSQTLSDNLVTVKSWKNANGDIFALNCRTRQKSLKSFPFTLKHYTEFSQYDNRSDKKRYFEVTVGTQKFLNSDAIDKVKRVPLMAQHPQWIDALPSTQSAVGIAPIFNNDITTAYLEALLLARKDLARMIKVSVQQKLSDVNQDKMQQPDMTKQIVSQELSNSYLHSLWLDEKSQTLYIYLNVGTSSTQNQDSSSSDLWQQFQTP